MDFTAMDSNEFIERYADGHRDFSGEFLEGLVLSRLLIQDLDLNGAILNNSEIVKTDIRGVEFWALLNDGMTHAGIGTSPNLR
ncbi:hypothetical protein [Acaryochloris marina]|uniref:Conserved domain protein n=1 Tax=Acaryochloris marina (strain MBIC 11017) TaxID=329726 RepID=B0C412_ACAM1|nr:hypothetical protein [Acaryochloris marina]ABW26272.1 conserved domain protein [Acaryochloris marina MBIC11017]BDM81099.1 hypothetical protein AM10699_39660 [Acaryochloris marina MBIC10699]